MNDNIHEIVQWLLDNGFKLRCGIDPLKYDKEDTFFNDIFYLRREENFYCNVNLNSRLNVNLFDSKRKKLYGDTLQISITINYMQSYKSIRKVQDIHLNGLSFKEMKYELGNYFLDIKRNIELQKLI